MKTLCVLMNYHGCGDSSSMLSGRSVADWISAALGHCLPAIPVTPLGPWPNVGEMVEDLSRAATGFDEVVLVAADAPFLRSDLTTDMLDLHRQYRADYTFADGYPGGLAPEILRPSILVLLTEWSKDKSDPAGREALFNLLSTDINRFDIETKLSPVDLRSRRLSFTADTKRNRLLLDRYALDSGTELNAFLEKIEVTAARARTLPATLHVQITDGVLQVPLWSPLPLFVPDALERRNHLSRDRWNDLLDRALKLSGDLTVLPGFWGEPSLHPQVLDFIADALAKPGLTLCIETSGLGWSQVNLESLAGGRGKNLQWIVDLDSDVEAIYRLLRGEGLAEAQAFMKRLLSLFPGQVWPQTVRMTQNENEMEAFYQRWRAEAGQVIIQKHNDFGGRLPRGKPSDLSPWKRHPCWHLARDLAVFVDGNVVVCHDDFQKTQPLGNVWTQELEAIWDRGSSLFERHTRDDYPEVCRKCDEWYTFHF